MAPGAPGDDPGGGLGGGSVRAVLLDYGDTLITVRRPEESLRRGYGEIAAYLRARHGPEVPGPEVLLPAVHDRVEATVLEHARTDTLEEIDLAGEATRAYGALGIPISPEDLDEVSRLEQEAWWAGVRVGSSAMAALHGLRSLGLAVGICSNAPYRPRSLHAQLDHLGLSPLLDAAVFSSEVGWRKPSPRIFEAALDALGAEPATTVMVGDTILTDVEGAHRAGMRAVRVREHSDDLARRSRNAGAGGGGDDPSDAVVDRLDQLVPLLHPLADRVGGGSLSYNARRGRRIQKATTCPR